MQKKNSGGTITFKRTTIYTMEFFLPNFINLPTQPPFIRYSQRQPRLPSHETNNLRQYRFLKGTQD